MEKADGGQVSIELGVVWQIGLVLEKAYFDVRYHTILVSPLR